VGDAGPVAHENVSVRQTQQDYRPRGGPTGAIDIDVPEEKNMPRRTVPDPFASQVGTRIRELRAERGMSLADLADASELSKGHLSSVEHGLAAITIQTISRLAKGLGVPALYILTFQADDERAHTAELVRKLPADQVRKLRRQLQVQLGIKKR
jgi:transcriptional regulator with XRE-family HTH domain